MPLYKECLIQKYSSLYTNNIALNGAHKPTFTAKLTKSTDLTDTIKKTLYEASSKTLIYRQSRLSRLECFHYNSHI